MEYRYFNPNPQGLIIGDCAIRAGVVATENSYFFVEKQLGGHKNVEIIDGYNAMGGLTIRIPKTPVSVVCQFCETHPEYNYILIFDTHCVGINHNTIYDLFDCRIKDREVSYISIFLADHNLAPVFERELEKIIIDYQIKKHLEDREHEEYNRC